MNKKIKTENSVIENIKIDNRSLINSNAKVNLLYELMDKDILLGILYLKLKIKEENSKYKILKIEARLERNPSFDLMDPNGREYLVTSSIISLKLPKSILKDNIDYKKTVLDVHHLLNKNPDYEADFSFDILLKINDIDVDKIYLEFKKDKENHCKSRLTFIRNLKQIILSDKIKEYKKVDIEYDKLENSFLNFAKTANKVIFVGSLAFLTFNLARKTVTDIIDSIID